MAETENILPFNPENRMQVRWANQDKESVIVTEILNPEEAEDPTKQVAHVKEHYISVDPENDLWHEVQKLESLEDIDRMTKAQIESEQNFVLQAQKQDIEEIRRLAKENVTVEKVEADPIEGFDWVIHFDADDKEHSEHLFNLKLRVIEEMLEADKEDLEMLREAETPLELLSIVHSIME
tara:strand:+ start:2083 stop:2622 length:540 start_codon:yes stop_codon:yes gene_type:complete